jgi:hypothetical protein
MSALIKSLKKNIAIPSVNFLAEWIEKRTYRTAVKTTPVEANDYLNSGGKL